MYIQYSHQKVSKLVISTALLLLFMCLLSACGATDADKSINTTPATDKERNTSAQSSSNAESKAKVKTISTVNGDIEIPVHPKRIVAEEYLGSFIALDVIPVGAPALTINNYYFKEALTGVADTGVYGKPSVENILALSPDLIITGSGESYEMLSKIAPTIVIPYGQLKNVHEELSFFGGLFDKEAEAEAWLEEYDKRIAIAKSKVDAVVPQDASFSIMEDGGKKIWVYGDNFGRGGQPIYQSLERNAPAEIEDEIMEKKWTEISLELLDKYAGDYILLTSDRLTLDDLKRDAIWSNLPAVENGQVYIWPEERSWYYDPLAVLAQTEELTEWLVTSKN